MPKKKVEEVVTADGRKYIPYDQENVLTPIKMFIIVVPNGQAEAIIKILNSIEVSVSVVTNGMGTYVTKNNVNASKKQILFTFVTHEKVEEFTQLMKKRFNFSSATKGAAFSINISSIAGVTVYKFLTNTRKVNKA